MYRLHYQEKLRPIGTGGPLVFGNALDKALNELLLKTSKNAEEEFLKEFTNSYVGGQVRYLPIYEDLNYFNSDIDLEILSEQDRQFIKEELYDKEKLQFSCSLEELFENLKVAKRTGPLTRDNKITFNLIAWTCLRVKGLLMIAAYRRDVIPLLTKVHTIQKKIELKNSDGDSISGIVDIIADVKDYGTCILDNKTSTTKYDDNSVINSQQLGLYVHCLEDEYKTSKAGYIVMYKKVHKTKQRICKVCNHQGNKAHKCDNIVNGKRCNGEWNETIIPDIKIDIILDEIPSNKQLEVIQDFDFNNQQIKNKIFEKNLNTCENYFGAKCPYYNKCHGNSNEGLIDLKAKK